MRTFLYFVIDFSDLGCSARLFLVVDLGSSAHFIYIFILLIWVAARTVHTCFFYYLFVDFVDLGCSAHFGLFLLI